MRARCILLCGAAPAVLGMATAVQGSETTAFTYDALGRLVTTTRTGGPNNGIAMKTCFDPAGNRSTYFIGTTGAPACGTPTPTPSPTPTPTNRPPVAVTDNFSLTCNSGGGFNVLANDTDPDGDALALSSAMSNGGVTISVGNAAQGIVGIGTSTTTGSFTGSYVVTDGHGHNATGTINVTVGHGGPGGC